MTTESRASAPRLDRPRSDEPGDAIEERGHRRSGRPAGQRRRDGGRRSSRVNGWRRTPRCGIADGRRQRSGMPTVRRTRRRGANVTSGRASSGADALSTAAARCSRIGRRSTGRSRGRRSRCRPGGPASACSRAPGSRPPPSRSCSRALASRFGSTGDLADEPGLEEVERDGVGQPAGHRLVAHRVDLELERLARPLAGLGRVAHVGRLVVRDRHLLAARASRASARRRPRSASAAARRAAGRRRRRPDRRRCPPGPTGRGPGRRRAGS